MTRSYVTYNPIKQNCGGAFAMTSNSQICINEIEYYKKMSSHAQI